ncbi:11705_t:CDS:1, partial [Cetraspora pellucida]
MRFDNRKLDRKFVGRAYQLYGNGLHLLSDRGFPNPFLIVILEHELRNSEISFVDFALIVIADFNL